MWVLQTALLSSGKIADAPNYRAIFPALIYLFIFEVVSHCIAQAGLLTPASASLSVPAASYLTPF